MSEAKLQKRSTAINAAAKRTTRNTSHNPKRSGNKIIVRNQAEVHMLYERVEALEDNEIDYAILTIQKLIAKK